MQTRHIVFLLAAFGVALAFAPVLPAQTGGQSGAAKPQAQKSAQPFDPHDLSGIWNIVGGGNGAATCNYTMNPYPPDPQCKVAANPPAGVPNFTYPGNNVVPDGVHMTAWAHALWMSQDQGKGVGGNADPYEHCDPLGVTRVFLSYIHPIKIIQIPGETWMIYEEAHTWRVIYTDGRALPKLEDLPFGANWLGYSVGHWDGNDFIVETIGQNDKTWLDLRGHVHSEEMLLKDTYRRTGHDTLEVSFSFHDPKAYDKDWSYGPRKFALKTGKDWEIQESFCTLEDEQSFDNKIKDPAAQGFQPPRTNP